MSFFQQTGIRSLPFKGTLHLGKKNKYNMCQCCRLSLFVTDAVVKKASVFARVSLNFLGKSQEPAK
jgi:hypothetical protein